MTVRNQWTRARSHILLVACLVLLAVGPVLSAVKQVRVTVERATLYIEPSRTSARIETVGKGTILTLLQERKVKEIWYYVSFNSPRYGSRISGFIQDSAVELVLANPPSPPKIEQETPPKVEPKESLQPEIAPPPPPAPPVVQAMVLTKLPKHRTISLPKKEYPREDPAWQVIPPVIAKAAEPTEKLEVKPKPSEIRITPAETNPKAQPDRTQPIRTELVKPPRKGPGFFTLGLGYGSSFGGAGGCLQLNTRMGLSLHAGMGLYPTRLIYSETDWVKNKALWSIGLKYYLPFGSPSFRPFVDVLYGGLRVEAAQVVIGIWNYEYLLHNEQKSLWGPSFLAGVELRTGHFGISAALGASYATTSWDYLQNKVSFGFDAGLVLHF